VTTAGSSSSLDVDGRAIALTNLERVMYPATGTTKFDVVRYYLEVAHVMLPHLRHRPATRRRWPDGVAGEGFYEKNLPTWAPDWLSVAALQHRSHVVRYPLVDDRADLVWLAQSGALELHTPQWQVGADGRPLPADRLVLDLDPGPPAGLVECAVLARWVRERLRADGAESYPVTSGSKGIQVYARWPVAGADVDDPSGYAHGLARELATAFPELVVATIGREHRPGKVYVDWSQNNPAKTTIAPYSLRGRDTPTVAAPREWDELERADLVQLTADDVLARVAAGGDLLGPLAN
jgi:bifunctional non-homologous end joining protein LigD